MLKKVLGLLIAILMLTQPMYAIAAEAPIVIGGSEENLGTPADEQPPADLGEGSGDAVIPGTQTPEPETATFTVRFFGQDGALLDEQTVKQGDSANAPDAPEVEGFVFDGWDKPFNDVQGDLDVNAVYSAAGGFTAGLMATEPDSIIADVTSTQNFHYNYIDSPMKGSKTVRATKTEDGSAWQLWALPQNNNYVITGWYTNPEFTGPAYTTYPISAQTPTDGFYAKWVVKQYTVTFESNGGEPVASITKSYNETINTAPSTIKTGYTFDGWYSNPAFTTKVNFPYTVTGNVTLYAKWKADKYTLSYDGNGNTGGSVPGSQTGDYNTSVNINANTLTKNYYTADGWNTKNDGSGTHYAAGNSFTLLSDAKLYAEWKPIPYTIKYYGLYTTATTNPTQYTVESSNIILSNPVGTRDGFTFIGWTGNGTTTPTLNLTLPTGSYGLKEFTANWAHNYYDVTFTAGAHGSLSGYTSFTVDHGALWSTIAVPNTIPAAGYRFKTWSPAFPAGTDEVTGPLSFEATFEPITYNIVYTLNGGTNHPQNPSTYTTEEEVTLLAPTKTGYIFLGWEEGDSIPLGNTGDKTFTATWEAEKYTLSYDGNGATGGSVPGSATVDYNSPVTVAGQGTLVRTGYTFKGWKDGDGNAYSGTFYLTSNVKLYAQWEEDTYTLYYNANGGTGALPPAVGGYRHGGTESSFASQPPSLKKAGYTFKGWGTSADSGVVDSVTFEYSSITLFAQWQINTYTVTFYGRDYKTPIEQPQIIPHGGNATAPTNTDKGDGYRFVSWVGSYTNVTGNLDIYGLWLPIIYKITYTGLEGAFNPNWYKVAYTVEGPTITLADPIRPGYEFTGWTIVDGGMVTPVTNPAIVKGDMGNKEFTANWKIKTYTVTFKDYDGDVLKTQTVDHGSSATPPEDPSREGYNFTGWDKPYSNITGPLTVTAQYTIKTYTVTFYGYNDVQYGDPITVEHGDDADYPAIKPTSESHNFMGWDSTSLENVTDNLNVHSLWEIKTYTVTFYGYNDVQYGDPITVGHGNNADYPAIDPTSDSHNFMSWDSTSLENVTDNLNVHSLWEIKTYTVTFLDYDGNPIGQPQTVPHGGSAQPPADPAHDGYTFDGWDTDYTNVTDNLTIKSLWKVIDYPITYTLNGGTVSGNPATYTIESAFTLINPTRSGYTFLGWTGTGLSGNTLSVTVAEGSMGEREYAANWRFNPTPEETEIPLNPSTPTPTLTAIPENPVPGAPSPAPRTTPAIPAAPMSPVPSPSPSAPPTQAPAVTTPAPQQTQELVDIPEQEVPLEAQPESADLLTLVNLIAMIVTVIGAIVLAFKKFGKKDEKAEQARKEQKEGAFKRIGTKVIAAIAAVGSIVFFFLTQPLTPMDIWDKWSIWQLLILAVYAVMAIVAYSKKKEQDKAQNAKA